MTNTRGKLTGFLLLAQIVFIVMFGLFVEYDYNAGPRPNPGENKTEVMGHHDGVEDLAVLYPMYQDVHVMMLIGFGFLMTFLKRHGFGSVGFNFLLTCYVIEWALLMNGWFGLIGGGDGKIHVNIFKLLECDFAVATVLISFGAVLGKVSPVQLIVMATLEVVFYNINIWIGVMQFKAIDIGGSMFIHTFGAYFGLAIARVLYKKSQVNRNQEGSVYHSDLFAMIGTLFLWLYWPSFNAGPALGNERHRAVINTVLSLSACTVVTFAVSAVVDKKNKLDMVHIQNATLAGGVAMGASANLIVHPFGALLIGSCAGILSVVGYRYLQPKLTDSAKLHDTCGVNNLHGMPGILGACISAIACAVATRETYKGSYDLIFVDRDSGPQGGFQMAALATTLLVAIASGTMTGFVLKLPIFDNLEWEENFEDGGFWITEDGEVAVEDENVKEDEKTALRSSPRP